MNKLIKIIITIFSLINTTLSTNCFTPQDIINNNLVSYKNKVYNIDNYNHPGGERKLLLCKGKPLEDFFNIRSYKFHITSRHVKNDLNYMYVGNLYKNCSNGNKTIPDNDSNDTDDYDDSNEKFDVNDIINDSLLYPIISGTAFAILILIITIINYIPKLYLYFGKILNLYYAYITVGECIFMFLYLSWWILIFVLSIISEEIIANLGIWISLNIAFTLMPMTRNSIWLKFLNVPYNSLIFIHKFIALLTIISVIIKIIYVIVFYNFYFLFGSFRAIMGSISSLSILITGLFAIPLIRKNVFELFYYSHRILCILTIVTMGLHYIESLYYIAPSIILYIFDILLRIFYINESIYTKIQTYELAYDTKYILITLKLKNKIVIKPGSYFFVCCTDISNNEWHPISLLNSKNGGFTLCIKDMGVNTWSNRLMKYQDNNKLNILLQGPYSHFKTNYNYKYILCVANGIGITPFFSILDNIITNKPDILQKIIFIWIIQHESFITPFLNILKNIDTNLISINIYVTKSNNNRILDENYYSIFNIYDERPIIGDVINNFIIENYIDDFSKLAIFSCGTKSLSKDIAILCSKLNIDLYNENFS